MDDKSYRINGFEFSDIKDYREAEQEAESIEYIKANTDMENYNEVAKLYHRLAEKNTFKTAVGIAFLKELQERVLEEGIISKANIACIRINPHSTGKGLFRSEQNKDGNSKDIVNDVKIKLRNSRIISLFLTAIIIIMLLIAIFSDRSVYTNYENKILNKYSAWEENLEAREKALQDKNDSTK